MSAKVAAQLGLLLLVVVSAYAHRQRRRGGLDDLMRTGLVANLLGVAVLWLRTDKPVEGHILLALGEHHGVTVADLLVFVPLLEAWLLAAQDSRVSALLNRR